MHPDPSNINEHKGPVKKQDGVHICLKRKFSTSHTCSKCWPLERKAEKILACQEKTIFDDNEELRSRL